MIEFKNVTVQFTREDKIFTAVDAANLEIKKGEFFGIVGSSGAGKSTLVRTVNLLQRPTSGSVIVDGKDITKLEGAELCALRLKIGMIFQHFNLVKNASVFDNVAFALKASNTPKSEIAPRVDKLLELVGLSDKAKLYPNSLSGGQKQRVAIASSVLAEKEILIFDEPTSGLDYCHMVSTAQLFKELRDMGKSIFIITHDRELIERCCNYEFYVADRQAILYGL